MTDLALAADDQRLYMSCRGTGEMEQYDVSDCADFIHDWARGEYHSRQVGSVRIGGIVGRKPHPARPDLPLASGAADGRGQPRL